MSTDMTGEQMQAKITAARREAEGLKDRIKRKKDELADTSRTLVLARRISKQLTWCSEASRATAHRSSASDRHEAEKELEGSPGKNLCDALV